MPKKVPTTQQQTASHRQVTGMWTERGRRRPLALGEGSKELNFTALFLLALVVGAGAVGVAEATANQPPTKTSGNARDLEESYKGLQDAVQSHRDSLSSARSATQQAVKSELSSIRENLEPYVTAVRDGLSAVEHKLSRMESRGVDSRDPKYVELVARKAQLNEKFSGMLSTVDARESEIRGKLASTSPKLSAAQSTVEAKMSRIADVVARLQATEEAGVRHGQEKYSKEANSPKADTPGTKVKEAGASVEIASVPSKRSSQW